MTDDELLLDLELSSGGLDNSPVTRGGGRKSPSAAVCASYRREERLQYQFLVFYNTLVAILAAMTLLLLLRAGWAISGSSHAMDGILAGIGALVSGSGSGFLIKERNNSLQQYRVARKALARAGC